MEQVFPRNKGSITHPLKTPLVNRDFLFYILNAHMCDPTCAPKQYVPTYGALSICNELLKSLAHCDTVEIRKKERKSPHKSYACEDGARLRRMSRTVPHCNSLRVLATTSCNMPPPPPTTSTSCPPLPFTPTPLPQGPPRIWIRTETPTKT